MGLQIGELVPKKEITIEQLRTKLIAIDAHNIIYQFLSNIRQQDGTPLMDNKGKITSHLSGLFYRSIKMLTQGIKPVYVFDGTPPELKKATRELRAQRKQLAQEKYEEAKKQGSQEDMLKYSKQTVRITEEIVDESKKLLKAMGIPIIEAPSEGEAQAAQLAKHEAFSVISQDYDSLLFGAPRVIQNLTFSRKKRLATGMWVSSSIELIELDKVLNSLQINHDQLICLGILSGTDFNPGGVKGIGPKKGLELIRRYKEPVLIFEAVEKQLKDIEQEMPFDWKEIFELFKKPNVIKEYEIKFKDIDKDKIKEILVKEHDFSEERIENTLEKLKEFNEEKQQKGLSDYF
ncbi:MAG: flap endonuclease-1 [archaeon]